MFKFNPLTGKLDLAGQGDTTPIADPETTFINELRVGEITIKGSASLKIVEAPAPSHIVLNSVTIASDGSLEITNNLSLEVA